MTHSKHYRWQLRWHVDRAARIARHDTGAVVYIINGIAVAQDAQAVIDILAVKHGHNAPEMLQRMLREVGRLWASGRDDGPGDAPAPLVPQIPMDPVPADSRALEG